MQPPRNKSKRSPNRIPPPLENKIHYYFKYIHPHSVKFEAFVEGCPVGLFGPPGSELREKVTTFYDKIRRSPDYHLQNNAALRDVTGREAPFAHQYFLKLIERSQSQRASPNNMSDNYDKSHSDSEFDPDEDGYDGNYVPSPPHHPFGDSNNRRTSSSSVGGGKMIVRKEFEALTLANINFSNGIPSDIDVSTVLYVLKKLNNVFALDCKDPSTLPSGVDAILVKDAPTRKKDCSYDKLILVLQVSDMESLSYISARLSNDGKVIIVDVPIKER